MLVQLLAINKEKSPPWGGQRLLYFDKRNQVSSDERLTVYTGYLSYYFNTTFYAIHKSQVDNCADVCLNTPYMAIR